MVTAPLTSSGRNPKAENTTASTTRMLRLSREARRSSRLLSASQYESQGEEGAAEFTVASLWRVGSAALRAEHQLALPRGVSRPAAAVSAGALSDVVIDEPQFVPRLVEHPVVTAGVQGAQISVARLIQPPGTVQGVRQRLVSADVARVFGDAAAEACPLLFFPDLGTPHEGDPPPDVTGEARRHHKQNKIHTALPFGLLDAGGPKKMRCGPSGLLIHEA